VKLGSRPYKLKECDFQGTDLSTWASSAMIRRGFRDGNGNNHGAGALRTVPKKKSIRTSSAYHPPRKRNNEPVLS